MSFMDRARALYQRGDAIRAAFLLAEGIKRSPGEEEALRWFLQIYVEDIDSPGLEQELIRVLQTQPDGQQLLELVSSELAERGQEARLGFLTRVRQLQRPSVGHGSRRSVRSPMQTAGNDGMLPLVARVPAERSKQAPPGPTATPKVESIPRRRRKTQSMKAAAAAQGVLPLESPESVSPKNDWSGFVGLAQGTREGSMSEPIRPDSARSPAVSGRMRTIPPIEEPLARTQREDAPSEIGRSPVSGDQRCPNAVEEGPLAPLTNSGGAAAVKAAESNAPLGERVIGQEPSLFDDLEPSGVGVEKDLVFSDAILPMETEEVWSLGSLECVEVVGGPQGEKPVRVRRRRTRTRRFRVARLAAVVPVVGRTLVAGARLVAGGKRGVLLLLLVGLVGAGGAWYRACRGTALEQIALADQALDRADGASLRQAVALYQEYLPSGHSVASERLDFGRALLAADYGEPWDEIEYGMEEALGVYGLATVALRQLAFPESGAAHLTGEALVERYGDHWLAHWTVGRIAQVSGDWSAAEGAYRRARELEPRAVLPVSGMVELHLFVGQDAAAEPFLAVLSELNSEEPLVAVGRAAIAWGLDPRRTAVGVSDAGLPDPGAENLSIKTRDLLFTLRARQALAARRMEEVAAAMQQLHSLEGERVSLRVALLDALTKARVYRLDEVVIALDQVDGVTVPGTPAVAVVEELSADIFLDLSRPELALARISEEPTSARMALLRAELLVDAGRETEALRVLGHLMEQPATRSGALRILVDYHLRRGAQGRARLRAGGLENPADQSYAAARLALAEEQWEQARQHAETALNADPSDKESLMIWAQAMARLGQAEHAIERIDEAASNAILLGVFDRAKLEVMVFSNRAPRETVIEYLSLLEATQPTSTRTQTTLALAYEYIGDLPRARTLAEGVLRHEPHNGCIRSLLERLNDQGQPEEATLGPDGERWSPTILGESGVDWIAYLEGRRLVRNVVGPTTVPGQSRRPSGR
ncbi:MAG: hypothetical protein JW797_19305 [Bradymonadales bacterium]|nr:hypothetical protein [Bradymonadales bacterium]